MSMATIDEIKDTIERLQMKNEALTDLLNVMAKHKLSFFAVHQVQGLLKTTSLQIGMDFYEDGQPIVISEVTNIGDAALIDISNLCKKEKYYTVDTDLPSFDENKQFTFLN